MNFIKNLRNKPETMRHNIALLFSAIVVIIIIIAWIINFNISQQKEIVKEQKTPSPFSSLKGSINNIAQDFKSMISNQKKALDGVGEIFKDTEQPQEGVEQKIQNELEDTTPNENTQVVELPDISSSQGLPENLDDLDEYFEIINE